MSICTKCNGTAYLPQYHYVSKEVCYQCNGTGESKSPHPRKTHTFEQLISLATFAYASEKWLPKISRIWLNTNAPPPCCWVNIFSILAPNENHK